MTMPVNFSAVVTFQRPLRENLASLESKLLLYIVIGKVCLKKTDDIKIQGFDKLFVVQTV